METDESHDSRCSEGGIIVKLKIIVKGHWRTLPDGRKIWVDHYIKEVEVKKDGR